MGGLSFQTEAVAGANGLRDGDGGLNDVAVRLWLIEKSTEDGDVVESTRGERRSEGWDVGE